MLYILNTFSPSMLGDGCQAVVTPMEWTAIDTKQLIGISGISHENTALMLSKKIGVDIPFNRINVTLTSGDEVLCFIPQFRATEAREFTDEEITTSTFKVFKINIL